MIEGWGDNCDQKKYTAALEFGSKEAYKVVETIRSLKFENRLASKTNKSKEADTSTVTESIESNEIKKTDLVQAKFQQMGYARLHDIFMDNTHDKQSRDDAVSQVKNLIVNSLLKNELKADPMFSYNSLSDLFTKYVKSVVRNLVLNEVESL